MHLRVKVGPGFRPTLCVWRTAGRSACPGQVREMKPQPQLLKIKFQFCRKFAQILIFTRSRVLPWFLQNNRSNRLTLADTARQGRK